MSASDIEVGDIVICHGMYTGKVVHKFLSYLPTSDYRDAMKFTPDSSRRARALEI
jgi:hypothetical protein